MVLWVMLVSANAYNLKDAGSKSISHVDSSWATGLCVCVCVSSSMSSWRVFYYFTNPWWGLLACRAATRPTKWSNTSLQIWPIVRSIKGPMIQMKLPSLTTRRPSSQDPSPILICLDQSLPCVQLCTKSWLYMRV